MALPQLGSFSSEALLEQGSSGIKKLGDHTFQGVKVTVQTAARQLTGSDGGSGAPSRSQDEIDFIKDLYGPSKTNQAQSSSDTLPQQQAVDSQSGGQDEQLAQTRQKLALIKQHHTSSYFEPTFNRLKQDDEPVAEKLEREEQERKYEEFEKQQKKPDFALQRAQGRAEMAPGASG